jgi:hypothetical protein
MQRFSYVDSTLTSSMRARALALNVRASLWGSQQRLWATWIIGRSGQGWSVRLC